MKQLFAVITLFCASLALGQERAVVIALDTEQIMIGGQTQLRIEVMSHAADTVGFPLVADTIVNEIEVLKKSKLDTQFVGDQLDQKVLTQILTVTSFDSGYHPIPPRIATINGKEVLSNPLLLGVQTLEIDTAEGIYDIKANAEAPFSLKEWFQENWHWFAYGLAAALLITAFFWWYFKRKKEEKPEPVVPPRAAHLEAFERLQKLKEAQQWHDEVKLYYSELTEILRQYIERRFLVPAMEQTSDEILISLKRKSDLTSEMLENLKQMLVLSDLVKFAKERPSSKESEMNLELAFRFVEETRKKTEAEFQNRPPDQPENGSND